MRKLVALITALGIGLLAPAGSAQATELGPHVKVAKVVKDIGRIGTLDNGDILKIRFSSPVKVTDISSFYIGMKGANGVEIRLENDCCNIGFNYTLAHNDTLLTVKVNYLNEEMGQGWMTYPVRLNPVPYTFWDGEKTVSGSKIWWNICGRTECRPINETKGDLLINK